MRNYNEPKYARTKRPQNGVRAALRDEVAEAQAELYAASPQGQREVAARSAAQALRDAHNGYCCGECAAVAEYGYAAVFGLDTFEDEDIEISIVARAA